MTRRLYVDPEMQARIDADFAAKTGPFRLAILSSHMMTGHYGIHSAQVYRALRHLKTKQVQAAIGLWIMDPALKDVTGREAMDLYIKATPTSQVPDA